MVKPQTIEISCLEVWREISNYIDQSVDTELRARIAEHLKHCNHCSAVLDGARNVVTLMGDGRSFDLPGGFGRRLYDKLIDKGMAK